MPAEIKGQIERITYTNSENGFTIARLRVPGTPELVTAVGNVVALSPGEVVSLEGEWTRHPKYGEQFKITHCRTEVPASVYGIEKYLGSGLIKGIGPKMAKRIVKRFGTETLDIIETDIHRLKTIPGIGKKRIDMITKAWEAQQEIREVMLFLQGHGVSSGYATKIFKAYGNRSISVVKQNPYRLATDIFGIGFVTADHIAMKLGFEKDSASRAEAGVLYALDQSADEGHVYFPYDALLERCETLLEVNRERVQKALAALASAKRIVIEDNPQGTAPSDADARRVYLTPFYISETGVADRMHTLLTAARSIRRIDTDKAVSWVQQKLRITLARNQVKAVRYATENKVLIITGGPGTGKTTLVSAILKIFSKISTRILLAAPTGRAAKRMSETSGFPARTIHRLLEYSMQKGGFQKNSDKPLKCDLLIVDEASMIDAILMYHLLKAVPPEATVILVGDINQLPSVGSGSVLKDLIQSTVIPVVRLDEIFRQARKSLIITNAHRINQGEMPIFPAASEKSDFYFIERNDPDTTVQTVLTLAGTRIPDRFGFDPIEDIQVLTPMHKGIAGAGNLNNELQNLLNPEGMSLVRGSTRFRINDKIMQIKNNYDKGVFNGDMGRINRIDAEMHEATLLFDGKEIIYDFTELDEIVLAYAVSVHKSQGSEYPAVIVPVVTQHYVLLQRNLIYTAVTRGKRLVILVGTQKALAMAIKNDRTRQRYTHLKARLRDIRMPNYRASWEKG
ncbi:MAG: ATP-dependent RecD-like DNA helicase [Deltaproteobacteria bacterium]|nr:ATP-dependent RecD-like DNA helicase [Deltaproteobacteria bacterium]